MNVCQIWVAASSDPFLVLHVSQLDCFLLGGRWRRLIVTSNHQLIDHHTCNGPKKRSNNWNPPPLFTSPGKQKENIQGKNCILRIRIFMFGSGTMQDLVISNHHWLAKDNSTRRSAAISSCPPLQVQVTNNSEQLLPGLPRLSLHQERREAVAVPEVGTFTSLPLLAGKHPLTARSLYCSRLS